MQKAKLNLLLSHIEAGLQEHDRNAIEETLIFTEILALERSHEIPSEKYVSLTKQTMPLFEIPHQNV